MVFKKENKYLKYFFFIFLIFISLVFFFLNPSYFKKNNKTESLNEFKIETKSIHSIFIEQFQNQHIKRNLSIKKGQSLNSILLNTGVKQKDIFDATRLLANYLNLKKINNNHIFQVILNKKKSLLLL